MSDPKCPAGYSCYSEYLQNAPIYSHDPFIEESEIEWNGRFDYAAEAYAGDVLGENEFDANTF